MTRANLTIISNSTENTVNKVKFTVQTDGYPDRANPILVQALEAIQGHTELDASALAHLIQELGLTLGKAYNVDYFYELDCIKHRARCWKAQEYQLPVPGGSCVSWRRGKLIAERKLGVRT